MIVSMLRAVALSPFGLNWLLGTQRAQLGPDLLGILVPKIESRQLNRCIEMAKSRFELTSCCVNCSLVT
ncbi:unnamed protein product [Toxocara canis]|uniref:Secreted protein n=1 Tax=Toxocara canis TaxID=6265 RepID=A0A183TYE8_TOXCA|nr:unnamed protein product [Toxocara canis]